MRQLRDELRSLAVDEPWRPTLAALGVVGGGLATLAPALVAVAVVAALDAKALIAGLVGLTAQLVAIEPSPSPSPLALGARPAGRRSCRRGAPRQWSLASSRPTSGAFTRS
jgi:hypothetical protein